MPWKNKATSHHASLQWFSQYRYVRLKWAFLIFCWCLHSYWIWWSGYSKWMVIYENNNIFVFNPRKNTKSKVWDMWKGRPLISKDVSGCNWKTVPLSLQVSHGGICWVKTGRFERSKDVTRVSGMQHVVKDTMWKLNPSCGGIQISHWHPQWHITWAPQSTSWFWKLRKRSFWGEKYIFRKKKVTFQGFVKS